MSTPPKVTLGLPVFNAEKYIGKKIESLLSQTYPYFEIIISDNASTDSTAEICREYTNKDKRIRFYQQEKNRGIFWNYNFILQKANSEYFMWTAVDDSLFPDFLEKNVSALEKNKKLVASIGKVENVGHFVDRFKPSPNESFFKKLYKKFRYRFMGMGIYSLSGSYDEKINFFLRKSSAHCIFALYRTDVLRKSMIKKPIGMWDYIIVLNALRYGDFNVVNETLWNFYTGGMSSKGNLRAFLDKDVGFMESFFPYAHYTSWCFRNFGSKLFLKNLDFFIKLNLFTIFIFFVGVLKLIKPNI